MKFLELHVKPTGKECFLNMEHITGLFENEQGDTLICFDDNDNLVVVSEPYLFVKNCILNYFNPTL